MARKPKEEKERIDPFANGSNDAAERLAEFVESIESKMDSIAELQEEVRDIYRELGGLGYETAAVRRVISTKKKQRLNREKFDREEDTFNLYCQALGIQTNDY